ncbi:bifunctional PIG-L family deacetylase/class I SAM-dependent methyltransferase [Cellulomonas sp. S1-8]|uniref:bifunctional PIG-L family deacetylase/class I SAM-dependent methyltransferase n=1 Tax=Cellulomonas sp. S1-8 TaxID=2904790 RepID=UPI0022447C82|nr:bifunctional PIG-L family deacetylase/class I SAM-dependent methyltransferase [Cellulomonas sp. S1-8]UZN03901.1 PIG-L family deacetylase [Cellulomonas sp. S1-8]
MVTFDARAAGTDPHVWDARLAALPPWSLPRDGRTVVVAAHPDDETLTAGGLLAELAAAGHPADVVVVTDGAGSHPGSPTLDPASLARRRVDEVRRAVEILSPASRVTLLGHPDGRLREARDEVTADLRAVLLEGPAVRTIVTTWAGDEHRDHRVLAEVCEVLAAELGCTLAQAPLWLWHWATPDHPAVPWDELCALPLSDHAVVLKQRAVAAHETQVQALSEHPADVPVLHPRFLRGFDRDLEPFVVREPARPASDAGAGAAGDASGGHPATLPAAYFDDTYARHDDPWGFTDRPYEARKRALTLASLPDERYARALEVGCSIGVLTADLADRCDALTGTDVADAALERARGRLVDAPHVRLVRGALGGSGDDALPGGLFDLVVLSEVGYYLSWADLTAALPDLLTRLARGGTIVACHWRHAVEDYPLPGDAVHRALTHAAQDAGLTRLVEHREVDLLLDVWSRDPRSVAERTGLR